MSNLTEKQAMNREELAILDSEYNKAAKSKKVMWLLWFFTGGLGGHRFYLGDIGYAIAMLFLNWATLGVWALIDAFFISKRIEIKNNEIEKGIIDKLTLYKRS